MESYLYGAAVQGIQSFIFQTNKLREIVGASELVEEICTTKFASLIKDQELNYKEAKEQLSNNNENAILFAAGNIKYIFQSKEECERIVRIFPKEISQFAPGITVSQAVVKMEGEFEKFEDAVNELEKRLRTQRNKPMRSLTTGLMGILRSRQSGLPVVDITFGKNNEEHWDAAKLAKLKQADYKDLYSKVEGDKNTTQELCKKAFGMDNISGKNIAHDIEDLTKDNDWIAIIHADGNGLGKIVQKITDAEKFKRFSQELDKATTLAAIQAYEAVKSKFNNSEKKKDFIPIRPIVLGGDDLTVICRADLALAYTESFIKTFENETKERLGDIIQRNNIFQGNVTDRLSVCAGIAYVKSSYPFYYAYELAEALCTVAKKDAKEGIKDELPKSCLMFHKVQDSFTEDWNAIAKRELTPNENTSFQFGPYYILDKKDETKWLLDDLMKRVELLEGKEGNAVKSHLRNWMSLLHDNPGMAKQKLERLKSITTMETYVKEVTKGENRNNKTVYPVYDILAIHTINNQKTK